MQKEEQDFFNKFGKDCMLEELGEADLPILEHYEKIFKDYLNHLTKSSEMKMKTMFSLADSIQNNKLLLEELAKNKVN